MHDKLLSSMAAANDEITALSLLKLNEETKESGLMLSRKEAAELTAAHRRALVASGRVEVGAGVMEKIIRAFSRSKYLRQEDYADVLHEITQNFYLIKNDMMDRISDDELISFMYDCFEKHRGSMLFMDGWELEALHRRLCLVEDDSDGETESTDDDDDE